jgi:N-methylhydantoinase B
VSWGVYPLRGRDALYVRWNGGGGYGDPLARDPEKVLADVRAGLVSAESAREIYGVALAGDTVDSTRTEQLRAVHRALRLAPEAAE